MAAQVFQKSQLKGFATSLLESRRAAPLAVALRIHGTRPFDQRRVYSSSSREATEPAHTDVIVVGSGLAGICAAIAAAENGASVLMLDRGYGGGASALSGGVVYAGGGTRQQQEAGYGHDTAENMFNYLRLEVGDAVTEATLKKFCDESVARQEWLESHGARFASGLCQYKTSYPTDKHHLYFSGNEKAYPYVTVAKPAPRGHRAFGQSGLTGGVLWKALFESAMRLGVRFQPASKVEQLIVGSSGQVQGVRYRSLPGTAPGFTKYKKLVQRALTFQVGMVPVAQWFNRKADAVWENEAQEEAARSGAVVLAAGGFTMNEPMRQKHIPWSSVVAPLGTAGDDGSGIRLGQSVGGTVSHMDRFSAWRFMSPPSALIEGIAVSMGGERIAAEDLYGATFSEVMVRKFDGRGYLILDSAQWAKAKSQLDEQTQQPLRIQPQYLLYWAHKKAASLDGLAAKIGLPSDVLKSTVGAYNDAIASGKEDPVHKLDYRSPITQGPFYAIDVSLRPSGVYLSTGLTLGGMNVDGESGMVLNGGGDKIQNLYAAGRSAVGICSNSYISGLSLADCVFSGKRAGEHAAKTPSK